ncbi:ExbD/TolR family protein [Rhodosalinus sp. 5P4]|uniref:ExbD/TolR family protein n=1 Tax=Rhodosalinus sp. 5P4 TaxID=3239196 RepID=UPI003525C634
MAGRRTYRRARGEPTIALINVVFLMLVFFLVAGSLAPPLDGDVKLVRAAELDRSAPPDALVIRADGTTLHRGRPVSAADYLARCAEETGATAPAARLVPDRALPARRLADIAGALRAAGAGEVILVTERALP